MHQTLHLLLVDAQRANLLATWTRGRWLLPILDLSERARAGQYVAAWARTIGLRARMIGQWLGRPAANAASIDWLAVAKVEGDLSNAALGSLGWQPTQSLTSSASWSEYQQWALRETTARSTLPSVAGPFGRLSWLDTVETWVAEVLGNPVIDTAPYRTTAYEVAVGFATKFGRVFFKGIPTDSGTDARTAFELCQASADDFASTLAFCTQADGSVWWLTAECPGFALAEDPNAANVARVAAACGRLQRATNREVPDVVARLPIASIDELRQWGRALLRTSDEVEALEGSIEQACAAVDSIGADGLLHVDLDPSNVFVHGERVRFIDLNELHRGPAPLIASMFADKLARTSGRCCLAGNIPRAVYRAYQQAWHPPSDLNMLWPAIEIVSTLLLSHLRWARVQTKLRRGEVRNVNDLVRSVLAKSTAEAIRAVAPF